MSISDRITYGNEGTDSTFLVDGLRFLIEGLGWKIINLIYNAKLSEDQADALLTELTTKAERCPSSFDAEIWPILKEDEELLLRMSVEQGKKV